MRISICIAFLFFSILSFAQPSINLDSFVMAKEANVIGKQFGKFEALLNQTTISNKNLAGKIVFVNFWFESCPPCIAEFDALNAMYDTLKNKKDFEFISFTYEPKEKVNAIAKQWSIPYKIISLPETEIRRLNLNNGFPTSFILDRKGIIKFAKFGGSSIKEEAGKIVSSEFYPKILSEL